VGLYAVEDGIVRALDFVRFGPQATDRSLGRVPDGAALLRSGLCPTPGAANADSAGCPGAPRFIRGDADGSGRLQVSDAVAILIVLFQGGGLGCLRAGDADDDGGVSLTDAVRVLGHLFLGGEALPPPFPGCGLDATADDLGCRDFPGCVEGLTGGA
jgi:hypothetical protein